MKKTLNILFIIVAILTILEYSFICGTFTGPLMMLFIIVIGLVNTIYAVVKSNINEASLYIICTIALCVGYMKLMV